MSAEAVARPSPAVLPRPTSLHVSNSLFSVPIIDTSSYSPFPTFPGSDRTRDPYGLDAYLLHPEDAIWSYVDPEPASDPIMSKGVCLDTEPAKDLKGKGVNKRRSLSVLHRPSPLGSQPPVEAAGGEIASSPRLRRRSSSVDSGSRAPMEQEIAVGALLADESKPKTPRTPRRKSIRQALHLTRKSIFGMEDDVPALPPLPDAITLAAPPPIFGGADPSTPMSSRSRSNQSVVSSASSTSSSEGVQTPVESLQLNVGIAGIKLADALAEAGEKKSKGKSWRGWLGGKRGSKLSQTPASSGSTTPLSDFSAASSPNSSSTHLVAQVAQVAQVAPELILTPSPSIKSPPARDLSPVRPPETSYQITWASEQLRRTSIRKMVQLRSPSAHPLALSLRRQHFNLPDEFAFSIQSGQKVFPMSVNTVQAVGSGLNPAQGGLWLGVAIKGLLTKLDRGEQPPTAVNGRKDSVPTRLPRPRGVLDFVDRPPFEERMLVYYGNDTFSPISMARPGYGVWDIDFSKYVLAMSEVGEPPAQPWPLIPRASMVGAMDEMAMVLPAVRPAKERDMEVLADAEPSGNTDRLRTPIAVPSSPVMSATQDAPMSSFRNARRAVKTWEYSSDEESEDESEDESLTQVVKKKSLNLEQSKSEMLTVVAPPLPGHIRSRRKPGEGNMDSRARAARDVSSDTKQRSALEEVVRARERREASRSGETERRAVAEQRMVAARRSSMMDMSSASVRHARGPSISTSRTSVGSSSSLSRPPSFLVSPASPRPRVMSQIEIHARPNAPRQRSFDTGPRRYHSFYDAPMTSVSGATVQQSMGGIYNHPAMQAFPRHPTMPQMGMYQRPVGPGSRNSLVVPHPHVGGGSRR